MALEDYNLGRLRESIMDEFGRDKSDIEVIRIINAKINDAITFINKKRRDWPWLTFELALDVTPSEEIIGTIVQGSRLIEDILNGFSVNHLRKIISSKTAISPTFGYLITDVTGTTYTLFGQWLASSIVQQKLTVSTGYVALPKECRKIKTIDGAENLADHNFIPRDLLSFKKIVLRRNAINLYNTYYTTMPDPLGGTDLYLAFYPYLDIRTVIYGTAWKRVNKLEQDTDIPVIPGDDRLTVLQTAYWLVSQALKEDQQRTDSYKIDAMMSLAEMEQDYELLSDPDNLRGEGNDFQPYVQMPPGYPDIRSAM